jgi:hypothetical protein
MRCRHDSHGTIRRPHDRRSCRGCSTRGHNQQRLRRYRSAWFDEDLDRLLALLPGPGVSDLPKAKDWLAPRRPYRICGQRAACGVASMVYFPAKGGLG